VGPFCFGGLRRDGSPPLVGSNSGNSRPPAQNDDRASRRYEARLRIERLGRTPGALDLSCRSVEKAYTLLLWSRRWASERRRGLRHRLPRLPENHARTTRACLCLYVDRPKARGSLPHGTASTFDSRSTPELGDISSAAACLCVPGYGQRANARSRPPNNAACLGAWSLSEREEIFTQRRAPHLVVAAAIAHFEHEE